MEPGGAPQVAPTGTRNRRSWMTEVIGVIALCAAGLAAIGVWSRTSFAGADTVSQVTLVEVFTFVETGIVYVEPRTSGIIWRGHQPVERRIGEDPWRNRPLNAPDLPDTSRRDIVGNPDWNVVAWVESVHGRRGDLVVVEANTGNVLARAHLAIPLNRSVVIASVDDEVLYFATPHRAAGWTDVESDEVWSWRWASGAAPRQAIGHPEHPFPVHDVSAGVWAVNGRGVLSVGASGGLALSIPSPRSIRTGFGSALSPDGRFLYAAGRSQILDTATGEVVDLAASSDRPYGWTGRGELTLTSPFATCSAATGRCRTPVGVPPQGLCLPYGVVCGNHLPVN